MYEQIAPVIIVNDLGIVRYELRECYNMTQIGCKVVTDVGGGGSGAT